MQPGSAVLPPARIIEPIREVTTGNAALQSFGDSQGPVLHTTRLEKHQKTVPAFISARKVGFGKRGPSTLTPEPSRVAQTFRPQASSFGAADHLLRFRRGTLPPIRRGDAASPGCFPGQRFRLFAVFPFFLFRRQPVPETKTVSSPNPVRARQGRDSRNTVLTTICSAGSPSLDEFSFRANSVRGNVAGPLFFPCQGAKARRGAGLRASAQALALALAEFPIAGPCQNAAKIEWR